MSKPSLKKRKTTSPEIQDDAPHMLTPAVSHPLQRTTSQVQRIDNGTLGLDADCLIGVLRLLLPEQVSLLRGVCWWWNDVACANYLWKRFYRLDFSPTLSRYNDDPSKPLHKTTWYERYVESIRSLPRFVQPKLSEKLKEDIYEYIQEDQNGGAFDNGYETELAALEFASFALSPPNNACPTSRMHKAAVIVSTLNENGFAPLFRENICVGYQDPKAKDDREENKENDSNISDDDDESRNVISIPVSQFTYSIVNGLESELMPLCDTDPAVQRQSQKPAAKRGRGRPSKKDKKTATYNVIFPDERIWPTDEDEVDYEEMHRREAVAKVLRQSAIGVAPVVQGRFTPFCLFLEMPEGYKMSSMPHVRFDLTQHTSALFGDGEVSDIVYWGTDENGWLPGYLNASFSWFSHGLFVSVFNQQARRLTVVKVKEQEMVW